MLYNEKNKNRGGRGITPTSRFVMDLQENILQYKKYS